MNELISRIMQHANISEESARSAADAVLGFLREKAPAPVVAQIESYLGGEGTGGESLASTASSALGGLGGRDR